MLPPFSVTLIRESLAEQLVKEEEWSKAAGVLAGIDLDSGLLVGGGWGQSYYHLLTFITPVQSSGSRNVDAAYKLSKSIKIAMLYLEDDDPVSAEMYIKKAASLIGSCKVFQGQTENEFVFSPLPSLTFTLPLASRTPASSCSTRSATPESSTRSAGSSRQP